MTAARLKTGLRIATAAIVLWLLFRRVPADAVFGVLRHAEPAGWLGAFVAALVIEAFAALRVQRLAGSLGIGLPWLTFLGINLASRFYVFFLPGGTVTSMAVRIYRLSRYRAELAATGAAIALDRIAATLTLCAVGLGFWCLDPAAPALGGLLLAAGLAGVLGLVLVARLGVFSDAPRVSRFSRALEHASAQDVPLVLAYSLAAHGLGVVSHTLVATALDLPLDFVTIGWTRSAIILATMLPLSVAGLGLREVSALVLFGLYGVPEQQTLAFSLLLFASTVLGIALVGGLSELVRVLGGAPSGVDDSAQTH